MAKSNRTKKSNNQANKYHQPVVTTESVMKKLEGCSPLQASKVLINMELYDKKSSLEVLDNIYEEFENKENVIDELVTPVGLSLLDSIITHKDLKLNRTGLTASRAWQEIKSFKYETTNTESSPLSNKQQLEGLRETEVNNRGNVQAHKLTKHKERNTNSDGGITNEIDGKSLQRQQGDVVAASKEVNTDHLESAKAYHDKYGKNPFLTKKDMKDIVNHDDNLASINVSQNTSKSDGTFLKIKQKRTILEKKKANGKISKSEQKDLDGINDKFPTGSLEEGIKRENKATKSNLKKSQDAALNNLKKNQIPVLKKAGSQAAEQTGYQAIGYAVILLIKPLFYELSDAIKFGFDKGVGKESVLEGLKFRLNRVTQYVKAEVIPMLVQGAKEFFNNFLKVLIEGILGLVTGLFKSLMKIISEGFSALVGAFKILKTPASEMSAAQKADAILKLLASTVVTFVVYYFESTIMSALPNNFIKDIALALLSGVASTIVVWGLDKWDLFSVKDEMRAKRVGEIFDIRIQQVKENTDAFETAAIEKLAQDKLQFRSITERMSQAIDNKENVNDSVYEMADFMQIDLKMKSTDDFMGLLEKGTLTI
jgi:hypothetical protein